MSDRSFLDKFAINSAGEVLLRRSLDYETADSYSYQVMVTDGIAVSIYLPAYTKYIYLKLYLTGWFVLSPARSSPLVWYRLFREGGVSVD